MECYHKGRRPIAAGHALLQIAITRTSTLKENVHVHCMKLQQGDVFDFCITRVYINTSHFLNFYDVV